jgi:hypothetical protein
MPTTTSRALGQQDGGGVHLDARSLEGELVADHVGHGRDLDVVDPKPWCMKKGGRMSSSYPNTIPPAVGSAEAERHQGRDARRAHRGDLVDDDMPDVR